MLQYLLFLQQIHTCIFDPEKWDLWNAPRVSPSNRIRRNKTASSNSHTNDCKVFFTVSSSPSRLQPSICVLEAKNVQVYLFSKSPQVHLGSVQIPAGVLDTRGWAGAKPHCCLQMNRGT